MTPRKTGAEAGVGRDEQIRIALQTLAKHGGTATIEQIYASVERRMAPHRLSLQGKATLRSYVNREAVKAGYIYPFDSSHRGWRITADGREYAKAAPPPAGEVFNVETDRVEREQPNAVRGAAFELFALQLLKALHPHYAWFHQGERKATERGLDFVGTRIGEDVNRAPSIGVQVKFHQPNAAPTQMEWLKFLAGCFSRRVEQAIFITTGRLTSEQRREAGEANVTVIEGQSEIARIAGLHRLGSFEFFTDEAVARGRGLGRPRRTGRRVTRPS